MADHCSLHALGTLNAQERAALLRRSETDLGSFVERAKPIVEAVKSEGDQALLRFARELDKADVREGNLKASEQEFDDAFKKVDADVAESIRYAIGNIRTFHEEQRPEPMWLKEVRPGAFAGDRWTPLSSAALYVPRGKGAFPSVTMMTAIPAVVAGVKHIVICTPPTSDGSIDAATLVAARIAGVSTVYKCGGAQAVAAVAYGTETVKPTLKIVGPGSPWVVAAKRLVSTVMDVGFPAGPSEAIVFADDTVDGRFAAMDVLIEAEHGPDSSAYLVTHSRTVAEAALAALPDLWAKMTPQRVEFARAVLSGQRRGIVLTQSIQDSYDFINEYAPEHLEILSTEPFAHLGSITEAAEILMGPHTPSGLI